MKVNIGGHDYDAQWEYEPDGGIQIYHGSFGLGSEHLGEAVIIVSRKGKETARQWSLIDNELHEWIRKTQETPYLPFHLSYHYQIKFVLLALARQITLSSVDLPANMAIVRLKPVTILQWVPLRRNQNLQRGKGVRRMVMIALRGCVLSRAIMDYAPKMSVLRLMSHLIRHHLLPRASRGRYDHDSSCGHVKTGSKVPFEY